MMQKEYRTVSKEACAELEEKKSRFIATVKPVSSEEEAQEFISSLRSRYWNASHNVYAYFICGDSVMQKFSDDGEPSGTAGLPVLETVKKLGVQDLAVVVTRYFGGTLLGAAGLVRAYGRCAALGIEAAGIIRRQLCVRASVIMEYTLLGRVQSLIASRGITTADAVYGQDAELVLQVPVDEFQAFEALVTEATNARAIVTAGEREYVSIAASG
jgi:uncharacterized YigZ family protein